ncbi:M1 family metallopeptidase [Fundidesulfovibrio putealis]|uniref:M1 family metallopeptidase n=1 Tax=Fundidesulfovibrio putealis TaxID=270496 RepID=UPI0003F8BFB4|nr:M1 family aminopeptidase [Fundidesulfovibrio putealis]
MTPSASLISCLLAFFAILPISRPLPACAAEQPDQPGTSVRHEIAVTFDPAAKRLRVTAVLDLSGTPSQEMLVTLSPRATGITVTHDSRPVRFTRSGETLRVKLPAGAASLSLTYSLPLDPPLSSLPATQDNPGALASDAACGPDWAMLMPGSLWHPEVQGAPNVYRLRVSAPSGVKAVTQGALDGFEESPQATTSAWTVARPVGRLGLCLARYRFEESRQGPVPVQTFLLEGSARLAATYLEASAIHLRFYQELHGPYPLEKFAVVENPLPTGYGFPSYTLLGSQVIALPFIPATSLRHEIAHSWWGNGVLVDYSQGNWCEGLTTYVADYLAQERDSPQAGRAYRQRVLRGFADLVRQGGDMPLSEFGSRFSPASQAVGYGKALFVFHMLREFVGDEAFWQGLRRLYADRLFQSASWEDIRRTFAGLPGFDEAQSRVFFAQWLTRTGGPRLRIADAKATANPSGGFSVNLAVEQTQPGQPYLLKLPLVVETDGQSVESIILLDGARTEVSVQMAGAPRRILLDPQADSFRVLEPSEVPPSVNSVKGAGKLTVILADDASESLRMGLPQLLAGLGQERARVVRESDLSPDKLADLARQEAILVAGTPRAAIPGHKDMLAQAQTQEVDAVFAALPRQGGLTAVFQAAPDAAPKDVAAAAAKVTHYGSFSVVGFKEGRNVLKQTLDAPDSPMVWTFR